MPTEIPAFEQVVEAFGVGLGAALGHGVLETASSLPALLEPNEELRLVLQADFVATPESKGKFRATGVLAATNERVLFQSWGNSPWHWDLAAILATEIIERGWVTVPALALKMNDGERRFEGVGPPREAERLMALISGEMTAERSGPKGLTPYPLTPPIGSLGDIQVYADRLVEPDGIVYPMGPEVHAEIQSSGDVAVTRGRNLAAKGVGGLFTGGLGLVAFGNAQDFVHDHRELYLLVEGPDWQWTAMFPPDLGGPARVLAQSINLAARMTGPLEPPSADVSGRAPGGTGAGDDVIESLERLARLRDQGIIDTRELQEQKARILGTDR